MKKIKKQFVANFNEEISKEDNGMAMIATIGDEKELSQENGMFVKVQSWDENKEHTEFKKFMGRRIKIMIETID